MRTRAVSLRGLFCAFIAVAFTLAVEPGAMAMPTARPATSTAHAMPACDHAKQHVDKNAPCKGMTICFGMLACYGMAAVAAADYPMPVRVTAYSPAPHFEQAAFGLTDPPENPPPIA